MNYNIPKGGSSQANIIVQLPGNAIHTVKFMGAEAKEIESKASGSKFNILVLKFKNDQGVFEDTLFELKEGDQNRVKNQWGFDSPSVMEEMLFKVKHLFAAIAPKVAEQIEKNGLTIGGWSDLTNFVVKHSTPAIGMTTQIKLLIKTDAKGNTRSTFPGFVLSINKAGEVYPKNNFIGATLAFTAKEQEKINAATTAKPTDISLIATPEVPALKVEDLDDLKFSLA